LVGGGVRDLYLGKKPKDYDISTSAKPGEIRKLFTNSRVIGRRFRLVQIFFRGGKIIEVSTFRTKSEFDLNGEQATLGPDNTYGSPEDDAFRRDLTINALFYEIDTFTIIDYTGGVDDLDRGLIRVVGDPDRRFTRDPVRMLRAIRHAARNNFVIEEQTWESIKRQRDKLALCPISRIRDELFRDLWGGASRAWAQAAIDSGLFFVLFPLYGQLLSQGLPSSEELRTRLLANFKVIDRIHSTGCQLTEQVLLGLIILPGCLATIPLPSAKDRQQLSFFSRQNRARIDEFLIQLDIKRSTKESMATLLQFYPALKHNAVPKKLRNKSFFEECLLFFRLDCEAQGGPVVEPEHIQAHPRESRKPRPARRGGRTPALLPNKNKESIFGLK